MFDEVNEGTQIMKIESHPPTNTTFLTYEGATSDYYLKLVALGGKMLREHKPITKPIPISPFDPNLSYKIVNRASGLALNGLHGRSGGRHGAAHQPINQASNAASNPSQEWQLLYDGAGYFTIKSKVSGTVLSLDRYLDGSSLVEQRINDGSANTKWELIWDGTGYCKIKNEFSGLVLSSGGVTTNDAPVLQVVADAAAEDYQRSLAAVHQSAASPHHPHNGPRLRQFALEDIGTGLNRRARQVTLLMKTKRLLRKSQAHLQDCASTVSTFAASENPKRIVSGSPGLRAASYPG